ncbi:GNAT family N-acetyltransferase [Celerinatantimonas sp. MCCC 1A17872]|uniref:GNAT family N-acetyltransferase n=1 Tax=Celerinatantimonas sp. MCCC 1A17872 TaxID=3177514 RepID=UPI0038C7664D
MQTQRLQILPPSMVIQPLMYEALLESENELREFCPWVDSVLKLEDSVANTQQAIRNYENFEGELRYSLINKDSGQFVGVIGLIIRDPDVPFFEIGYWLRSACVGFGYMSEAVQALEQYAFKTLDARRIEITAAEENLKSRAVAQRCNYQLEATLHNARRLPSGQLANTVVYAKTHL